MIVMERILTYTITPADAGKSILTYLRQRGYSHQNITALKRMPQSILVGGKWEYVNYLLKTGEQLTIHIKEPDEQNQILPVPLPLHIVYEDEDLLVINKPADMPIHPSLHNYDNTLANAVVCYYHQQGIPFTFRCINRLDRDTTGLTIIAKHMLSAGILSDMVSKREIRREYLALASNDCISQSHNDCQDHSVISKMSDGDMTILKNRGTVTAPIARTSDSLIKRCVDFERGEKAVTHYEFIRQKNGYALVSLCLETGRTHQIRVHMSYLGHPLLGDSLYGGDETLIRRQALHSHKLSFCHPVTREPLTFTAPLPDDMQRLL